MPFVNFEINTCNSKKQKFKKVFGKKNSGCNFQSLICGQTHTNV